MRSPHAKALQSILEERARQNQKWGEQNHDPITWSAILTEEAGEFAEAALHQHFGGPAAKGLRDEAVHVAAVALQIIEYLDRTAAKAEEEQSKLPWPLGLDIPEGWQIGLMEDGLFITRLGDGEWISHAHEKFTIHGKWRKSEWGELSEEGALYRIPWPNKELEALRALG